jgi:hypothetical protein
LSNEDVAMAYLLEERRRENLPEGNRRTYLGNGDVFVGRALAIRFATRDEAETKRSRLSDPSLWIIVED